jgi:hypothetical protein
MMFKYAPFLLLLAAVGASAATGGTGHNFFAYDTNRVDDSALFWYREGNERGYDTVIHWRLEAALVVQIGWRTMDTIADTIRFGVLDVTPGIYTIAVYSKDVHLWFYVMVGEPAAVIPRLQARKSTQRVSRYYDLRGRALPVATRMGACGVVGVRKVLR